MAIFKNPKFNFIGIQRYTFALSGALIIAGIVSLVLHHGPKYGIDFTGGSIVELHFDQEVKVSDIREKLSEIGLQDAIIQAEKGINHNYLIRTIPKEGVGDEIAKLFSPTPIVEREELVGPSISEGFRQKAFLVVLLGMLVILIYVSIRFTFRFGVTAVIALIHDVLITIGIFSLLDKEFNTAIIAALLTIIGYSINDSIVLSDRVRENLKILRKSPFSEIINTSINQTLSRTIITSLTTIFVLLAIFLFGGRVIHDFALAMLIGVVVGTYSSIFIVAALVVEWEKISPSRTTRR
ncbi:protein translocase subunit SecF [candidate division WOR-3 bacterium]|nr:protein translocase subunit SecF [candidate division WOR-3 bacterium]